MPAKPPALVFDLNGTLLDKEALRPHFERIFGDGGILELWFSQVLLYSQSATLTREFIEFGEIARGVLRMMACARGTALHKSDEQELSKAMQSLPPFAEVPAALKRLKDSGFRSIVLTNSSTLSMNKQIRHADIDDFFEEAISVDEVKKYKPAAEPYQHVADELDLRTRDLLMVAAHPWDLMGARKAGCEIAFLRRPGTAWISITEPPDYTASNLDDLASQLIAKYR
jgi:2-haloacid dehalogenase